MRILDILDVEKGRPLGLPFFDGFGWICFDFVRFILIFGDYIFVPFFKIKGFAADSPRTSVPSESSISLSKIAYST